MPIKTFLLSSLLLTLAAYGQEVASTDSSTKAEEIILPTIVIARPEKPPHHNTIGKAAQCSTRAAEELFNSSKQAIRSVGDLKESMMPDSNRSEIKFEKTLSDSGKQSPPEM